MFPIFLVFGIWLSIVTTLLIIITVFTFAENDNSNNAESIVVATKETEAHMQQHPTEAMEPRVVIILFGQYRTFDLCIESIESNVFMYNKNAKIVLVLDDKLDKITPFARAIIDKWNIDIICAVERDDIRRQHQNIIEFELVRVALEHLQGEEYDYLLKVRTDMFLKFPVDLSGVFGHDVTYVRSSFNIFLQRHSDNVADAMVAWLICGGCVELMDIYQDATSRPNTYAPFNSFEVLLEPLRLRVRADLNGVSALVAPEMYVQLIHNTFNISYLFNSTWMEYGHFTHMKRVCREYSTLYNKVSFNTMNYPGDKDGLFDYRREIGVTETALRAVHMLRQTTLIDYQIQEDLEHGLMKSCTFGRRQTRKHFHETIANSGTRAWLVRDVEN